MDKQFMNRIEAFRVIYGKPVLPNSGYRCKEYNTEIGGSPASAHSRGMAIDFGYSSASDLYSIVSAAIATGMRGIEVADRHVHLDISERTHGNPVLWRGTSK